MKWFGDGVAAVVDGDDVSDFGGAACAGGSLVRCATGLKFEQQQNLR